MREAVRRERSERPRAGVCPGRRRGAPRGCTWLAPAGLVAAMACGGSAGRAGSRASEGDGPPAASADAQAACAPAPARALTSFERPGACPAHVIRDGQALVISAEGGATWRWQLGELGAMLDAELAAGATVDGVEVEAVGPLLSVQSPAADAEVPARAVWLTGLRALVGEDADFARGDGDTAVWIDAWPSAHITLDSTRAGPAFVLRPLRCGRRLAFEWVARWPAAGGDRPDDGWPAGLLEPGDLTGDQAADQSADGAVIGAWLSFRALSTEERSACVPVEVRLP